MKKTSTSIVSQIIYQTLSGWVRLPAVLTLLMLQLLLFFFAISVAGYLKTGNDPTDFLTEGVLIFMGFLAMIGVPDNFSANGVDEVIAEPHIRSFLIIILLVAPLLLWLFDVVASKLIKKPVEISRHGAHVVAFLLGAQALLLTPFLIYISRDYPEFINLPLAIIFPVFFIIMFYITWGPAMVIEGFLRLVFKKNLSN